MTHAQYRIGLLESAGCTEAELELLCYHIARGIERWPGRDFAVGLVCEGIVDPTERNNPPPDVAGTIVRWEEDRASVHTFFLSRTSQFERPDKGCGHFRVAETRLIGGSNGNS